jgi:hypothetical protein
LIENHQALKPMALYQNMLSAKSFAVGMVKALPLAAQIKKVIAGRK